MEKRYTLADALTWDESERIEPIYGDPVMMAPPVRRHQEALMELSAQSFVLEDGRYSVKEFGAAGDRMKVNVLEDCTIDLSQVFSE